MEFSSSDIFFLSSDNKVILFALFVAGFFPYIRDVLRESTHPHPISWFMWSLPLVLYSFSSPYDLFSSACAASTVFIFILSLRRGASDISRSDWIYLVAAGLAPFAGLLFLEGSYNEEAETQLSELFPLFAGQVLIFAPFGPTFRKSISRPFEETLSPYIAAVVFWTLMIYPFSFDLGLLVFFPPIPLLPNLMFIALVFGRRIALGPQVIDRADQSPSLV